MINQKAPRDRTVDEFIDLVEERYHTEEPTNMNAWINTLRMIAAEPAPNPFTEDQLATMRELQISGFKYAAADSDLDIFAYRYKPRKSRAGNEWLIEEDEADFALLPLSFLQSVLSPNDQEPLCFADYAPLPKGELPCSK